MDGMGCWTWTKSCRCSKKRTSGDIEEGLILEDWAFEAVMCPNRSRFQDVESGSGSVLRGISGVGLSVEAAKCSGMQWQGFCHGAGLSWSDYEGTLNPRLEFGLNSMWIGSHRRFLSRTGVWWKLGFGKIVVRQWDQSRDDWWKSFGVTWTPRNYREIM